ncbi:hypothetical protein Hypma_016221 [Hypsizygus marmoreus]|uniref:Uncharacterized protein n=1 Tax=Hypsizygus marmoreus TaxID=39966 RepID=A0A369IXX5_HYPMA|nr:hypothetical protein Hypma_016221 [Hypsizygus marmoreus]
MLHNQPAPAPLETALVHQAAAKPPPPPHLPPRKRDMRRGSTYPLAFAHYIALLLYWDVRRRSAIDVHRA